MNPVKDTLGHFFFLPLASYEAAALPKTRTENSDFVRNYTC